MNYKINIPRKTFDGLCSFLQHWGDVYAQPNAVVLRGSLRTERLKKGHASGVVNSNTGCGDAAAVSKRYTCALHGLGRSKVMMKEALLDLRDLGEEEMEAMEFVSKVALLLPQQQQVLVRVREALVEFRKMPAMLRLAIAAQD